MSLQSLVETYINEFNTKVGNPKWLADLRRTVTSRNISISDWRWKTLEKQQVTMWQFVNL